MKTTYKVVDGKFVEAKRDSPIGPFVIKSSTKEPQVMAFAIKIPIAMCPVCSGKQAENEQSFSE